MRRFRFGARRSDATEVSFGALAGLEEDPSAEIGSYRSRADPARTRRAWHQPTNRSGKPLI